MSRPHRFILRLILAVAFATFLFALWAFVGMVKSRPAPDSSNLQETNAPSNTAR